MSATRLLFLSANSAGAAPLAFDEEVRAIQLRLRSSGADARFELRAEWALRAEEIPAAIQRHRPHLVHFSSHGLPTGELLMVSDQGNRSGLVMPETLRAVFQALAGDIICITVNACYSLRAAQDLAEVLPCAIGMVGDVSDCAAIAFSAGFYEALAFGNSVKRAFELGRSQILLAQLLGDVEMPRLLHRRSCEPTTLFALPSRDRAGPTASKQLMLGEQLQRFYLERDQSIHRGLPTSELQREIARIRRLQRQGHQLGAGEILAERYSLLEIIGEGGFARVWQSFDLTARRLVALKVLRGDLSGSRHIERFQRGARKMRELSHPYIVRVVSEPEEYEGFFFFAMEYIRGGDLAQAIQKHRLSPLQGLRAVIQAGEALEYAHRQGLIHRDVKPSNILLDDEGNGQLTDFDLVWAADTTGGTRTSAMGTFLYAAPELQEDASSVDRRVDVFGLGMSALFVLYGKNLTSQILQDRAAFMKRLKWPSSIKNIISRAIAWSPEERYPTAAAFITQLEQALAQAGLVAESSPPRWLGLTVPISGGNRAVSTQSEQAVSNFTLSGGQQPDSSGMLTKWNSVRSRALSLLPSNRWRIQNLSDTRKVAKLPTDAASDFGAQRHIATQVLATAPSIREKLKRYLWPGLFLLMVCSSAEFFYLLSHSLTLQRTLAGSLKFYKVPQDEEVERALGALQVAVQNRTWSAVLVGSEELQRRYGGTLMPPQQSEIMGLRQKALSEQPMQEIYQRLEAAAQNRDHEEVVRLYGQLAADSVYRTMAQPAYDTASESFVSSQLLLAAKLREHHQCAEFIGQVQKLLDTVPGHPLVRAEERKPCTAAAETAPPEAPPEVPEVPALAKEELAGAPAALVQANQAYSDKKYREALTAAQAVLKSSDRRKPRVATLALRLAVLSACQIPDASAASHLFGRLDDAEQDKVLEVCKRNGFQLAPSSGRREKASTDGAGSAGDEPNRALPPPPPISTE